MISIIGSGLEYIYYIIRIALKVLIYLFILVGINVSKGQNKAWDSTYGGSNDDQLVSIKSTFDNNIILGGYSLSNAGHDKSQNSWLNSYDYWIMKIDTHGNKLWDKKYGGLDMDSLADVILNPLDSSYLLVGSSSSSLGGDKTQNSRGGKDYWIVKIDQFGNKLWDKRYGGTKEDILTSALVFEDGCLLLTGYSNSNSSYEKSQNCLSFPNYDYWVIKIDSAGNQLWDKTFGCNSNDYLMSSVLINNGNILLCGHSNSDSINLSIYHKSNTSRGYSDYWIICIDSSGNIKWDKTYGSNKDDLLYTSTLLDENSIILGGVSFSDSSYEKSENSILGSMDIWLIKIDSNGTIIWDKTIGSFYRDRIYNLTKNCNDDIFITGYSNGIISVDKSQNKIGKMDFWSLKVDGKTGNKIWDKTYGGKDFQVSTDILVHQNAVYIAGISSSNVSGDKSEPNRGIFYDYWVIKYPVDFNANFILANGCIDDSIVFYDSSNYTSNFFYWDFGDTFSGLNNYDSISHPTHVYQKTGTYYIKFKSSGTCSSDSIVKAITIKQYPYADIGNDTILCENDTLVLNVQQSNAFYKWAPSNDTVPIITINSPGNYSVEVTNDYGCKSVDSITVLYNIIRINLGNDSVLCPGDTILLTAPDYIGARYLWQPNGDTFHSITIDTTNKYIVEIVDTIGCKGSDTVEIIYIYLELFDLGNDTSICQNDSIVLDIGIPLLNYLWYPNGENTSNITIRTTGKYKAYVTNGQCYIEDSIYINVNSLPVLDLGNDLILCNQDSIIIDAGSGFAKYAWSTSDTAQLMVATKTNNYEVTVTDTNGCSSSSNLDIQFVHVDPIIDTGTTTKHCEGDIIILRLINSYSSYLWSTGNPNSSISINQSGNYSVTVTDINNCSAISDTINFYFSPPPKPLLSLSGDVSICEGGNIIIFVQSNYQTYLWNTGETTKSIKVNTNGNYYASVTNEYGCDGSSELLNISLIPSPANSINLKDKYYFCPDSSGITIDPGYIPGANYLWKPTEDTTQIINLNEAGKYKVTVNISQCYSSDSFNLVELCKPIIYIPNIFSPNQDLLNDTFFCYTKYIDWLDIIIFNSWGQIIYRSNGELSGWDGRFQGDYVPVDTYFYVVKYSSPIIEEKVLSGHIKVFY